VKFYILGSNSGLGLHLRREFNCENFDRPYDLVKDMDNIVNKIKSDSVVILNAHAEGKQIKYVEALKDRCRLVVCGSIASQKKDFSMPMYSQQKQRLEEYVLEQSLHSKMPMLYLRLTSSSYRNYNLVSNTIRFWLDNPDFTFAGYNINE
jgi:hypothetical protein